MRKIALIAMAALLPATLGVSNLAKADNDALQCTNADQSTWMSEEAISQSLLAQGFAEIRKIKVSDGHCYEAYVVAANGDKKELMLDPVSGKIVAED